MEEWQAKALELLPDFHDLIHESSSPMDLWTELYFQLAWAYDRQPFDDEHIGKIYEYAGWCLKQPNARNAETDISSAAAVGLVETIPLSKRISDDLYRWMSAETFDGCENLFRYHLSEEEYKAFAADFHRKQKQFTGSPRL